ncbi:hypothetical protein DRO91_10715 [Candidatus Heimdallarchaeota archaeon]|nr:MAG: hypothetical protein DRO91_10715 [Candidatus Heimdallarchaeota archaeon]
MENNEIGGQVEGTIKWISKSDKNNSFNLKGSEEVERVWYKVLGADVENFVKMGDEVGFEYVLEGANRSVIAQEIKVFASKAQPNQSTTPDPGAKWQDEMVKFEDLLTQVHQICEQKKWGLNIHTELIDKDMKEKWAVCRATVTLEGTYTQIFQGTGDATQENCGGMIKPHFIRMAETRAIARALRWATNNARATEEETEKTKAI